MVTLYGVINMPETKKNANTPLLETKEVVKHYPITGGVFLRPDCLGQGGRRSEFEYPARRDPGPRGRIWLRQIDLGSADSASGGTDQWRHSLPG